MRKSFASILMSISSASGRTATVAAEVWMRPCVSVAGTRWAGGRALLYFLFGIDFLPLNRGDDFLEAAERRRRAFEHFDFPALRFRVARIHAEKFGGKESGFVAARAGADFDDDALFVKRIFWEQQKF